ncbi:hypothetical protein B0G69_6562 [Paraburkholderia sp. RAU2J]|nr:hypothetical protein B0G69_6562 [Paraburkholderia sp. RAU2J]
MTTANVRRYVVNTQETYERNAWRSAFFVGVDDPDPTAAFFGESSPGPLFSTADGAASAALRRGVEFAGGLPDPAVIGLLTLYP